jgi:hypothetical protein
MSHHGILNVTCIVNVLLVLLLKVHFLMILTVRIKACNKIVVTFAMTSQMLLKTVADAASCCSDERSLFCDASFKV